MAQVVKASCARYIEKMNSSILLLERLGALIQTSLREDAARHGLLPIHIQVMEYLSLANRYSDLSIAVSEYFGITRGTVSQTLSLLERKGLLTKESDSQHGKRVHLKLTATADSIISNSWAHRLDTVFRGEKPEDAQAFEATLRKLLIALQQQNGQRAFGICRQCAHFLTEQQTGRCGLTGEPLELEQTQRICREWMDPEAS